MDIKMVPKAGLYKEKIKESLYLTMNVDLIVLFDYQFDVYLLLKIQEILTNFTPSISNSLANY